MHYQNHMNKKPTKHTQSKHIFLKTICTNCPEEPRPAPHLGIDCLLRHSQDLASIPELLLLLARFLDLLLDPVGGEALDAPAAIRHDRGWACDGGLCGGAAGGGADGGIGEALLPAVRLLSLPGEADLPLDHRLLLHPAGRKKMRLVQISQNRNT